MPSGSSDRIDSDPDNDLTSISKSPKSSLSEKKIIKNWKISLIFWDILNSRWGCAVVKAALIQSWSRNFIYSVVNVNGTLVKHVHFINIKSLSR